MTEEDDPTMPTFVTPEKYWDVVLAAKEFGKGIYSDWEGMTSREEIEALLPIINHVTEEICPEDKPGLRRFIHDMLMRWTFLNIDQGDYTPTEEDMFQAATMLDMIITSRYQMRPEAGQ